MLRRTALTTNLSDELEEWLKDAKRIVVVGIGNELRKDDFVGVKIVKELKNRVPRNVMLIESETVPESFIEPIVEFHPTHVLLIDAGLLKLKPGEMRLIKTSELPSPTSSPISTHALPLQIFCEYIRKAIDPRLALIVIQPRDTDFGEGLSAEVENAALKLTKNLLRLLDQRGLHAS